MILGIGTDIVDIMRMKAMHARWRYKLEARLLSALERETAVITPALLAKRFAAKEALLKALGWGLRGGLSFQDISVVHDVRGAPNFQLSGVTQALTQEKGVLQMHLSITDEKHYTIAFVILER